MIRMRRYFPALFTLFIQGNLVWSLCTEENVQIEGGAYALSNGLKQGSVLKYRCDKGFYPHPDPVRVCHHDDTWEPAPRRSTCRRVECPDPAVLENCYVFPSEPRYFYQNQITYQCHEGFRLDGPANRTCLSSGKWSGRHPVCHQDAGDHCLDPGVPPGGSRMGSIFDIGETVRYSCYGHSMVLIGSEERVCQEDRLWSGTEPTCYYPYTFDSPLEVSQEFGGGIKNTLVSLGTEMNSTQEGRKIKLTTTGKLNIYIAVDVSMSIDQADFEMAKEAVITLIEKIAPFSVTPKYEIVFFASEALELINILTYAEPLAELVNRLKTHSIKAQDKFGTNLNVVFEKFLEKIAIIKQREGADFEKFHHAIIIFTDGHYNRGKIPTETVQQIKSTVLMNNTKREEHLDIYAFGIGKTINDGVLQSLTFGTEGRHYFRLESLEKLHETFDEIIDEEDVRGLCGLHRDTGEEDEDMDDETKREKYPWLLSVSVTHNMKTSTCLGSLVSHRFVLTAAHCIKVDKFFDNNVQVDVYKGKETLAVKGFHKHPKFNISAKADQGVQEFYDYDVALIELTKDVDISFSLRPICLPCTEQTNGALRQNYTCEEQERQLIKDKEEIHFLRNKHLVGKEAHLKLGESREDCILKARNVPGITSENVSVVVTENFLCSGGFEPYHDHITCKGDSGGAVFTNQRRRTIQITYPKVQTVTNLQGELIRVISWNVQGLNKAVKVAVVSWGNKLMKQCKSDDDDDFRSDEDSRDFHFNLFRVLPFLRGILGKPGQGYAPLVFV